MAGSAGQVRQNGGPHGRPGILGGHGRKQIPAAAGLGDNKLGDGQSGDDVCGAGQKTYELSAGGGEPPPEHGYPDLTEYSFVEDVAGLDRIGRVCDLAGITWTTAGAGRYQPDDRMVYLSISRQI